jgi:hypothetical protein
LASSDAVPPASDASASQELNGRALSRELEWIADVLWPASSGVLVRTAPRVEHADVVVLSSFGVLPNAVCPRLLIPLGSPLAAARALNGYQATKRQARIATALLGLAARVGLVDPLLRHRLYVLQRREDDPRPLLIEDHLRMLLDDSRLRIAVRFSPGRPQKKPVLQALARDGRVIGYVKVGWNPYTRKLVNREAAVLRELQSLNPRSFRVPRLLDAGDWDGLALTVVEPSTEESWRRGPGLLTSVPLVATNELFQIHPTYRTTLGDSIYWSRLAAAPHRGECAAGASSSSTELVRDWVRDSFARKELEFGFAHGDWVPWNMAQRGDRLHVWDWERAEAGAPRGLDATNFILQVHLNLRKRSPADATRQTVEEARRVLPAVGASSEDAVLLVSLHLLEALRRLDEGRRSHVGGVISDERYLQCFQALVHLPER